MKLHLTLQTPLFTGDGDGKSPQVRANSLIGSLHWWHGAVCRGLGKQACEPVATSGGCKSPACGSCALFGCTERAASFILRPAPTKGQNSDLAIKLKPGRRSPNAHPKATAPVPSGVWPYDDRQAELDLVPMRAQGAEAVTCLKVLAHLATRWGALGGKTSQGMGVCKLAEAPSEEETNTYLDLVNRLSPAAASRLPSLSDMFFCKVRFTAPFVHTFSGAPCELPAPDSTQWDAFRAQKLLPVSAIVRACLRCALRDTGAVTCTELATCPRAGVTVAAPDLQALRHKLLGERAKGSRIRVSHIYKLSDEKWELRIWGLVDCGNATFRDSVKDALLGLFGQDAFWQHMLLPGHAAPPAALSGASPVEWWEADAPTRCTIDSAAPTTDQLLRFLLS